MSNGDDDDNDCDVVQCLDGLRKEYSSSLDTVSSDFCGSGFELTLDDDNGDGDTSSDEVDHAASIRRISIVEERLYEVLNFDSTNVHVVDDEKLQSIINNMKMPKSPPPSHKPHSFPCIGTYKVLPSPPTVWPQRPLMVRPTPYTSTKVIGIRRARGSDYQYFPGFCAGCILPINNGKEKGGEALVIDFESTHFVGTMLLRIKQAPDNEFVTYNTDPTTGGDYFAGKKRKFQVVVRGRFKTALSMSHCVTGQTFDRPAGRLPARWIVTAFIKFMSTLAPQLEATLNGQRPRFLTPLVATAHTVLVEQISTTGGTRQQSRTMEASIDEPPSVDVTSILADLPRELGVMNVPDTTNLSVPGRMKARKKVFNALAAKKSLEPRFVANVDTEYTFEFYQHLLDFGEEMAVDLGRVGGKVGLAQVTDGQPLKIMAAYRHPETKDLDTLWSFDVWHESLYPYAEMAREDENG